jgi:uncharacterized repeat protein (TIGR02543 family)
MVDFMTNKGGTAYYLELPAGSAMPKAEDVFRGGAGRKMGIVDAGIEESLAIAITLTPGAKDVYIMVADADNNLSNVLKFAAEKSVVSYDANDGSDVPSVEDWDWNTIKLPASTRTFYTLAGWYNGNVFVGKAGATYKVNGDAELTARWIVGNVKAKFNANSGKVSKKKSVTITKAYGSKLGKLMTPVKKWHTFKGWYTKKKGGTKVTPNTTLSTAKVTFYAHWEWKAQKAVTKKAVSVYSKPGKKSSLPKMKKGQKVKLTAFIDKAGTKNDWFKLKYKKKTVYLRASSVKI